jgi:hypothetical protein
MNIPTRLLVVDEPHLTQLCIEGFVWILIDYLYLLLLLKPCKYNAVHIIRRHQGNNRIYSGRNGAFYEGKLSTEAGQLTP